MESYACLTCTFESGRTLLNAIIAATIIAAGFIIFLRRQLNIWKLLGITWVSGGPVEFTGYLAICDLFGYMNEWVFLEYMNGSLCC
ncbi:hypothetical protein F0562_028976 [Nyssa sinensis]|uniref:Uncharacterized protein n=1 Tax=Nyssa sinensis TaxID=561372 RepID=A0A5J5B1M1_9ASTE|nr:hypothetical protein F0562_028976 [Nyssa sinensis]